MERYQDKKAVIIGGTSGMGLATARMLIDGGARVLVTGLSHAGLESAQNELGTGAFVVASDVRSLTDIDALAARVMSEFDTFDLLFVNAGFSIRAPLESVTEEGYDEMFNVNAKGPFFTIQKLSPLINRGGVSRPHDLDRECKGDARQRRLRRRQGCAAVLRPCALHGPSPSGTSASTRCRPAPPTRRS